MAALRTVAAISRRPSRGRAPVAAAPSSRADDREHGHGADAANFAQNNPSDVTKRTMNMGTVDSLGARLYARKNSFQAKMIEMKIVATNRAPPWADDLEHFARQTGSVDASGVEHIARHFRRTSAASRRRSVGSWPCRENQSLQRSEEVESSAAERGSPVGLKMT